LIVRPDCLDEFETLTGEMVASTRAKSGVLAYQRFISEDRQTVYVHERYENSDAAVAHLVKFAATFGGRYGSLVARLSATTRPLASTRTCRLIPL